MSARSAKHLNFLLFILAGIVIGGFLGTYLGNLPYMGFLKFGDTFGMSSPLVLDLGIMVLTFGLTITINIAGIIGILIAIILFKKL